MSLDSLVKKVAIDGKILLQLYLYKKIRVKILGNIFL